MKEAKGISHRTSGVHPVAIEIGLGAALWFLAVVWLAFAWGPEFDFQLTVVTGFFVIFFGLVLLTASYAVGDDPRGRQPKASFTQFLRDDVPIDSGKMPSTKLTLSKLGRPEPQPSTRY
jgi:hypothetical protein